jgi:hypothetical protein
MLEEQDKDSQIEKDGDILESQEIALRCTKGILKTAKQLITIFNSSPETVLRTGNSWFRASCMSLSLSAATMRCSELPPEFCLWTTQYLALGCTHTALLAGIVHGVVVQTRRETEASTNITHHYQVTKMSRCSIVAQPTISPPSKNSGKLD